MQLREVHGTELFSFEQIQELFDIDRRLVWHRIVEMERHGLIKQKLGTKLWQAH